MTVRNILDLRFAALALVCASAAHVLAADAALPAGAVATVNGQAVQRSTLDLLAKTRRGDDPDAPPQDRSNLLDDLVMMELLSQRAQASGLAARVDTQAELELARKSMLGQRLLEQLAADVTITDEALQARYQEIQPELEITASHILLDDEAAARQVIKELEAGASFANLARKRSADEYTRDKGGRLGSVKGGDLESAFVAVARTLKPGGITTAPVQTAHGWHVVQLHSMRSLEKASFETMKQALRSQLVNERVQAQVAQWRKEARLEMLQAP
jgi:peptidyl-prolyl cis-trans isomerase C